MCHNLNRVLSMIINSIQRKPVKCGHLVLYNVMHVFTHC